MLTEWPVFRHILFPCLLASQLALRAGHPMGINYAGFHKNREVFLNGARSLGAEEAPEIRNVAQKRNLVAEGFGALVDRIQYGFAIPVPDSRPETAYSNSTAVCSSG